jgi:hypothetical protein
MGIKCLLHKVVAELNPIQQAFKNGRLRLRVVVQACNPSCSGGRDRSITVPG